MKKLLKIFAVMFIVSVALLAVAAYVPNGDVADAVTADCTHEYSEVVLAQQPSCTQEGWLEHYTCTLCEKYFVKVGEDMVEVDREDISSPVLVHKWSDWFVKPATCTEEGGEMRYCALCGATEHRGDTIDATGHNLTHHEAVASTCEVAGNSEYWSCDRCGLYFSDGQGSQPIEENSWMLPLAEHTEETIHGKAATCTETGLTDGVKCSVCGTVLVAQQEIPATGHNLTHHEAVESTCEVAGNSEYWSCDRCGLYFSDGQGSQPIEENSWMLPLAEHTEETIHGKAATCTETGLTDGVKCSVCGTVLVAQQVIPATGHTVVTDEGKAPTCTETGLKEGSHCSVCNEVLVSQEVIPATGHTCDAVTTGNNVCTVCEHEITQAEIVEKLYALESGKALDGTYLLTGIVTNIDDTNATIIVEEKVIYLYSFQSTNTFLVGDRVSVVGTLKHFDNYYEFDKGTVKEVTHPEYTLTFGANVEGYTVTLADGSPVPTSATNGTTYEVKITAPKGYKVASVTVNETVVDMSESGTYSVTVCGETTVHVEIVSKMFSGMVLEATVDSLGLTSTSYASNNGEHIVGNYTVTTNQIMLQSGVMQWQKNKGSLTVEGTFDKIVVNYTSDGLFTLKVNGVEVEADTSVAGVLTFDLGTSQTGTFVIEVGNETGKTTSIQFFATICEHEWGTWAHKSDATCTESATESRICDLCGAEEVRTVGEPLGHTWGDWTSNGNNTHTRKCSLCGEKVTENCTFVDGKCEVCGAQEVVTHSVTVGYTVNGNATTTLPEGVTVEILGEDGQPVTDLANVVEGTITIKVTAEGFDIVVTCNSEPLTLQDGEGTFDVNVDVTLSVTLTTKTEHKGTAEDPYSVADALAIASVIGQGNYTEKVYIKGLVIDAGENKGSHLSNIYIADTADGTKMLVFSAKFSETVATIYKDDTVVFHGYITNFNGTLEIAGKDGDYPKMTAVTRGSRTFTVQMENATTTLPTSAPIESTVTFTVTPDKGYEVVSVKVNGNFITPVDGTYSFVVGETNAVVVTTQVITTKHQVSVSSDVEGYTVTTDNGIALPGEVFEGTLKFTVTAPAGYEVATVSVGDTVLTLGDDGYYTTEVAGEITINVTFKIITKVSLELTSANLGLERYNTSIKTVTVDGVDFEYLQLMKSTQYSNSIQMKSGDGYVNNVTPFGVAISQITLKAAKDLASAKVQVEMKKAEGDWVTIGTYVASDFADNQVTIPVDLAENYLYVKVSSASGALYFTSITIECEKLCEHVVETWTPNNGTHTGTCNLCGETVTEDCTFVDEVCEVCGGKQPVYAINTSVENATIATPTGDLPVTALHGTELAFTVTPAEGFVVTEVKVNGETVEAVEGVYTITVKATVNIDVTTQEESTVPAEPTEFVKITDQNTFENAVASGAKFLIVYEDGKTAYVFDGSLTKLDAANNYVTATIENGQIADSAELQASSFAITASASGYNIQSASGLYIGSTSNSNELKSSSNNTYVNNISFSSSNVMIQGTATTIKFNNDSNQMRFRYYKSGQKSVCLYALI